MLLRFEFANFLSFAETASINLTAGSIKEHSQNLFSRDSKSKLLRSIAIYGANASGKSNVLKAFDFLRSILLGPENLSYFSKLSSYVNRVDLSLSNKPILFDLEFIENDTNYRYTLKLSEKGVMEESLCYTAGSRMELIFLRVENSFEFGKVIIRKPELKKQLQVLSTIVKGETIFAKVLLQFNLSFGQDLANFFKKTNVIFDGNSEQLIDYTASLLEHEHFADRLKLLLYSSDLGFQKVEAVRKKSSDSDKSGVRDLLNEMERKYDVFTHHDAFLNGSHKASIQFELMKDESIGTQKYFGLSGPLIRTLTEGGIIFIDEMDSRFHTNLLLNILSLFNSDINNPNNAQLVFVSHNTSPLKKMFRRDQMYFVEKNRFGISSMSSLYKKNPKVRNDSSFEKDYLAGEYGAIPRLPNQLNLF